MRRNMKIFFLIIMAIFFSPFYNVSQAQINHDWTARYNGTANGDEVSGDLAIDSAGNVYVTGASYDNSSDYDYVTIKYDTLGNQLWVARYNGPGNSLDSAQAIALDPSGNIYVTGYSTGEDSGYDYATVKYDPSGNQLWVARYNGPGNSIDQAVAITLDPSDNVYVGGTSYGKDTAYDLATIKYDSSGNRLWIARYNGTANGDEVLGDLAIDSAGNVYVTGASYDNSTDFDYVTMKYDPSGSQLWVVRYNGPGDSGDRAQALTLDPSGNIYVTGYSVGEDTDYDLATVKYDPSANQLWVARYNGPGNSIDQASAIALDPSSNIYVTGTSYGNDTHYDFATIKYDNTGNQLWEIRYNGPGNREDVAKALSLDSLGNVYVTGISYGDATDYDFATIKYDNTGNQMWTAIYNGPANGWDEANKIELDTSGNIYVTGTSYASNTSYDYVTIKYTRSNTSPYIPSNPLPLDGAVGVITLPLLSWAGGDPDPDDSLIYDVYLGTDTNPARVQTNLEDTNFAPAALNYSTTYYWQVIARDRAGEETNSPVWSFTTRSYSASNQSPVARSNFDQVIATGSKVTLEGSESFDPDGDSLGYYWSILSKPEKSEVTVSGTKSRAEVISFIPDKDGLYKFELIVYDGQDLSSSDYVTIRALGKEAKIVIGSSKTQYQSGEIPELFIWAGNALSSYEVKADVFLGFGLPDGRIYFLDPAFSLVESNPADSQTYTPFVENVRLIPGWIFPSSSDMNADRDGNGKQDSYQLPEIIIPIISTPGPYFAFAGLAEPGSIQRGSPSIIGPISLAYFILSP